MVTPGPAPTGAPQLRLFCLPYAGGSQHLFRGWAEALPAHVEVCPVELPGRGTRFAEPALDTLEPVVEDVLHTILPRIDRPFAVLGYSYGALLAFEAVRRLEHCYGLAARALLVAAMRAPCLPELQVPVSHLPEPEFRTVLRQLDGTPAELLAHEDLMTIMSPVLRADFRVVETYPYHPWPMPTCPVVAFGGTDDTGVDPESLRRWRECVRGEFTAHLLPGGHFFLHTVRDRFLALVGAALGGPPVPADLPTRETEGAPR